MQTKTIIFGVITVVLFIGIFFLLKPKTPIQDVPVNQEQKTITVTESTSKVFELVVKGRKLVSGDAVMKVNEGDLVVIKITIDEAEETNLHAYDNSIELEKDEQGQISFVAKLTGRFPLELEKSKTDIAVLEVMPKQ